MAATNDPNSLPAILTAPCPPSPVEAECYYYGIPSQPRLVARSSANAWVKQTAPEAYLIPKESSPIGVKHPLRKIWEPTVGLAMVAYLDSKRVKWTSLDPLRMGYINAGQWASSTSSSSSSSHPVIIWMGVIPGSLSGQDGVEVATYCKGILSAHGIDDVHVEIRESVVIRSAAGGPKMYKPALTSNGTARAREPFSTALGLPICAEDTPFIEGTGGFFISDPRYPGKIYLVTARHVVFPPDRDDSNNELYQHLRHSGRQRRRRNVLLFGDAAIEKHITAIGSEIRGRHVIIENLQGWLKQAEQLDDEEDAEGNRNEALAQLEKANKAVKAVEKFLVDVSRDWKKRENRVLGYVVLSPPIGFGVGEEGFTEDWAVIEMEDLKIDGSNFVGNVIDLGITIPVDVFTTWMVPHWAHLAANDRLLSFTYPGNRLLKFDGTISDDEMWKPKPSPKTLDNDNDHDHDPPCIMVMKRGYGSDLTVGRLNTLRSFTRVSVSYNDQIELDGQMSKEIAVLPRNYKSGLFSAPAGAFSGPGDSGSAVVDGKGRVAGLLTGGAGAAGRSGVVEDFDCTYLTSINFLLNRMEEHGLKADLSPSLNA